MKEMMIVLFVIFFSFLFSFFIYWKFWFLRDPERKIPKGKKIVAPADGRIIKILEVSEKKNVEIEKGLFGKIKLLCKDVGRKCYIISIFMSPLDVHIQRASYSGKVLNVKHVDGSLRLTNSFKNGLYNEKTETLIENKEIGKFKIVQIAGFFVRRIENWTKTGQYLKKGERIGLINFGSQVCLVVPKEKVKLKIKQGEKVKAGETIVAEIK